MAERQPPRMESTAGATASGGAQAFFDRGDRRTHLEQLRHLSQWSRRVLLVTGPRGVGKSTLYRQLSATLEPRAKAARINGSQVSDSQEVLTAMVQGFGLAAPADAGVRLLRELIGDHADAQQRSERFCVTLIDDAELLDPKALESLIELAGDSPMRLVLFGEVRLVPAIERLAETRGVEWHEIRLTGFGVDDVRAYVEWRLRRQGHSGPSPFTDAQVREIARLSEGLPGRIDQMINVLLARIQSAGHGPAGRRFPPLPALHRIVLAALVLVVGFAWILWPADEAPEPAMDTQTLVLPALEPEVRAPIAAPGAPVEEAIEDLSAPPEQADGPAEPVTDAALRPPADVAEGGASAAESAAVAEAPAAEQVRQPSLAEPQTEPAPAAPPADPPAADREAPAETAAADAAERGPAAGATPAGPQVRDAAWILQQPASAYTLQLVSFSTAERTAEYLAEQPDPENFARFRLQRDGGILHVVIYGRFESRPAAEAAAGELPPSVGRVEPWIRSFGQIQEGVRSALQP